MMSSLFPTPSNLLLFQAFQLLSIVWKSEKLASLPGKKRGNEASEKLGMSLGARLPCEDVINANFPPDLQLLNSQLTYYVRGGESRGAQNAIIEFAISLKTRKRNLFTMHLNVGL